MPSEMPMLHERAHRVFLQDTEPSIHEWADAQRECGARVEYMHPVRPPEQLRDLRDEAWALNARWRTLGTRAFWRASPEERRIVGMVDRVIVIPEWREFRRWVAATPLLEQACDRGFSVGLTVAIRVDGLSDAPWAVNWIEAEGSAD